MAIAGINQHIRIFERKSEFNRVFYISGNVPYLYRRSIDSPGKQHYFNIFGVSMGSVFYGHFAESLEIKP
ncbi:hypothetical protein HA46_11500 [Pantoea septica]|uniref:Uncharacterized protein n=1 Tax=Pantoea septica TaxID=472695 RepID=A0ABX3URI7_9GAMM|nr:hypothetical protein HA46_11500 [Pantoea septica]